MPELPEVQTTVNGIEPLTKGQTIEKVVIHNAACRLVPDAKVVAQEGETVISVSRKAKYILLELSQGYIVIHLGMSGNLKVVDASLPLLKHDHVEIFFTNGKVLRYNDHRRFGGVCFVAKEELESHKLFAKLGPDALAPEFNADYLIAKGKNRKVPIKSFLMNNEVVVGVGNIYANESLYKVGINPLNRLSDLKKKQVEELVDSIKAILKRSIELGGTTLKDFEQPDGKPGYFAQELECYGRGGEYSEEYDDYFVSLFIAGRNSFFLPKKQPLVGWAKENEKETLEKLKAEVRASKNKALSQVEAKVKSPSKAKVTGKVKTTAKTKVTTKATSNANTKAKTAAKAKSEK